MLQTIPISQETGIADFGLSEGGGVKMKAILGYYSFLFWTLGEAASVMCEHLAPRGAW